MKVQTNQSTGGQLTNLKWRRGAPIVLLILGAGGVACGGGGEAGGATIQCGPGTVLVGDTCVPSLDGGPDSGSADSSQPDGSDDVHFPDATVDVPDATEDQHPVSNDPADIPARVDVPGGSIVMETAHGTDGVDVAPFRAARTPTTVGQYRRCVDIGACSVPDWPTQWCQSVDPDMALIFKATWDVSSESQDVPLTCVSPAQAMAFCAWAGAGRLPTIGEWLKTARGPQLHDYPWGDTPHVDCSKHPLGADGLWKTCCDYPCDERAHFSVGKRDNGSPYDAVDVNMSIGELVALSADSPHDSCASHYEGAACVSHWRVDSLAGSISDSFTRLTFADEPDVTAMYREPFTFRCIWEAVP